MFAAFLAHELSYVSHVVHNDTVVSGYVCFGAFGMKFRRYLWRHDCCVFGGVTVFLALIFMEDCNTWIRISRNFC